MPHITETYACILWVFFMIILLRINFLISLEIYSTPNPQKYIASLHTELSNDFLLICTPQDLLHMPFSLFYVNQFFNKHHQIWITFDNIFVFQNLMKYDVELKILYCSTCSFNNCNCAFTLNIFSNKFPNKLSC